MILSLTAFLLVLPSWAQEPDERWRTAQTAHFRFHYPESASAWALDAADQMEDIRLRVTEEVGWVPPQVIDVVVVDPFSDANGSAWPFTGAPRMLLWATPPGSDSVIGNYRSWGELLLVHEYAHLVHLLRDSRNPMGRTFQNLTGTAPISRKAPRWVSEGYATVVEARLSGFGRPNADTRALLLRRLAEGGQLPQYGQLNDFSRFMGGSFAYLVGSAYLEWLEERAGEGSLRDLWARMTARETRSFDEAFTGLYGDHPSVLYQRFSAELTAEALRLQRERQVDEGTLWNDLSRGTGAPVVSRDGTQLAAVVSRKDDPPVLRVWSLVEEEPDPEEEAEAEEEKKEARERDPEDVPDVDPKHPPRTAEYSRVHRTRNAFNPQWMPDGTALLFTASGADASGRVRPDLYLWNPESGEERRVTRGADVRDASPYSDGQRALAVRQDWGRTHLVVVDLDTGAWTSVTEPDVSVVVDHPAVAPGQDRAAWLENRGNGWEVVIQDAVGQQQVRVGGQPGGASFSRLAWSPSGEALYATMGSGGFTEIVEVWSTSGAGGQQTRSSGGALTVSASEDALFYLSMDYNGYEIHRLALADVQPVASVSSPLPVVRPEWVAGPPPPEREAIVDRPYGLGQTEFRPLIGGGWSADQAAIEGGFRFGDLVGRRDALIMGSYGGNTGVSGGLASGTYRGLPVAVVGEAFAVAESRELMRRMGAIARLQDSAGWNAGGLAWRVGAWMDQPLEASLDEDVSDSVPEAVVVEPVGPRQVVYADWALRQLEPRTLGLGLSLGARGQLGQTDDDAWRQGEARVGLTLGRPGAGLQGSYTVGATSATSGLDRYRLGGLPTSVLPEDWQWMRVQSAGFAVGQARGAARDELRASVNLGPGLALEAERHRMSGAVTDLGAHANTLVSVNGALSSEALPFGRIPAVDLAGGVGCRVEDPTDGWAEKPCTTLGDYGAWASVRWKL